MPKEYINWPEPVTVHTLDAGYDWKTRPLEDIQTVTGLIDPDGKWGPDSIYHLVRWQESRGLDPDGIWGPKCDDEAFPKTDTLPPMPRVGLHWDKVHGTVQLSLDIDWDVLQEIVKSRQDNPNAGWLGEDEGKFPNRQTFFTGALDRNDLQRLIKHTRRARNDAFGVDE